MIKRLHKHSHLLHKTGMFMSFLCLIHCLAMPFLITTLPIISHGLITHKVELGIITVSLIIGFILLLKDYKVHFNKLPLIFLSVSAIIQIVAWAIMPESNREIFIILGTFTMALAYLLNWNLHRKSCSNHNH